jgi:hypothetical protein
MNKDRVSNEHWLWLIHYILSLPPYISQDLLLLIKDNPVFPTSLLLPINVVSVNLMLNFLLQEYTEYQFLDKLERTKLERYLREVRSPLSPTIREQNREAKSAFSLLPKKTVRSSTPKRGKRTRGKTRK